MSVSVLTISPDTLNSPPVPVIQNQSPTYNELEYSFSVPHSISRLWYIIRDANLIVLLCPDFFVPLITTKGRETWGIGTEFLGQTTISTTFTGKCVKYKSFPQIKKLSWYVQIMKDPQKCFYYDYTLYKVTENDSSVLLITIKAQHVEILSRLEVFFAKKNFFSIILDRINLLMDQSSLSLFQFEGVVIDSDMESIWKFLTHFDILKKIAPLIPLDGDCKTQIIPQKVGEESLIYYNNHKGFVKIKTIKFNKRENWNKWIIMFTIMESNPVIPKHEVLITVNKINEDECHISWFHDFKEPAPYELLQKLSEIKKYILQLLQDFLENYSPKSIEENDNCFNNKNADSDVSIDYKKDK